MSNNVSFLSAPSNPSYSFPFTSSSSSATTNSSSSASSFQQAPSPSMPYPHPSSSSSSSHHHHVSLLPPSVSSNPTTTTTTATASCFHHPHSLPSSISSSVNHVQPSSDIPLSEPLTSFLPAISQGSPKSSVFPPQLSASAPDGSYVDMNSFHPNKQSFLSSPYYSNTYSSAPSSYYTFGKDAANDWYSDIDGNQLSLSQSAPANDDDSYRHYSQASSNLQYKPSHVDSEHAYHLSHYNDLHRQHSYLPQSDPFSLQSFSKDYCPPSDTSLLMTQQSNEPSGASVPSYSTLISHLPPSPNLTPVNVNVNLPIVSPDSSLDTLDRKEKMQGAPQSMFYFGTPSPKDGSEKSDTEKVPPLPSIRDPFSFDDAQRSATGKKYSPNKPRRSSRSKIQAPRSPGGTSFICHICQKKFKRSEHLRRHIHSLHTTDKPFACFCGKRFSRRDNLRQHERMHANSGTYFTRSLKNNNVSPILPPASSIAPNTVPMSVNDGMSSKSFLPEQHPVLLPKVSLFPMYYSADPKNAGYLSGCE
ncbi:transcription factor Hsr1 [Schizosaccharomyces octosporus yFS286]|uniref:Transcription factor Hsr1 n=1 Tax=Schizosaccharomyces octosporus (strain yFS286) TaxID=483514 RepID=S9PU21_SCHOY|nr:transcription factor Hsr1 [Schizosaccharomyces octosporus yFS286]EPX72596.1 transcription factor Hsr1 [Schizosaccharomyces octosporus yFS286]